MLGKRVTVPGTEVSLFVDMISFPGHKWTKAAKYPMSDLPSVPISKRCCPAKVAMACTMQLFPNYWRRARTEVINIWSDPQNMHFKA